MAQMLRLNERSLHDGPTAAEVKKRVFLSLFMADRWCSFGLALPIQIQEKELPSTQAIDEAAFCKYEFETFGAPDQLAAGLWAHKIELASIFGRIQLFIHSVVKEHPMLDTSETCANTLASLLADWKQNLPDNVKLTRANLDAHQAKQQGSLFIDLHLGYHYYSMLLYFPFLGRHNVAERFEHLQADKCKDHALAFTSLLVKGESERECEVVHATVGHMTVISSAALLYHLLSGPKDGAQVLRETLSINFGFLVELQTYWPSLTKWVSRDLFQLNEAAF